MHPASVRTEVLRLAGEGLNDCEIARRLDLPRTTVRDMRRPRQSATSARVACPRCGRPIKPMTISPGDYVELLGLYLGDGCVSQLARTCSLRISLDVAHPTIADEAEALLRRCFSSQPVTRFRRKDEATIVLCVYSAHLPCLLPQHGPGKKHTRRIVLEPWQDAMVRAHPWRLIKALIRTDGCSFINRTGHYEYLSFEFFNLSSDLLDLFTAACDAVGVRYRRYDRCVRIYRRESVALLVENVGVKA